MRVFLIVLDSVGIGEAPDAGDYGDIGANTLAHIAAAVGGLNAPALQSLGLGNIPALLPKGIPIEGVSPVDKPMASYAALQEVSKGKDTTTGHWELAGLELQKGFHIFPPEYPSFPKSLLDEFVGITNRDVLGNKAASGTRIIEELGAEQLRTGRWIVYTSADSVMQIAAHEDTIPLEELYSACQAARRLCNPYSVGRVIARPYIGAPGSFTRTENRRDYSFPLPEPTILDHLTAHNVHTITVGKLDDIFANSGIAESFHVENNTDAQDILLQIASRKQNFFAFANLIDFDMLYGHRRNPEGYARAIENTDDFLGQFISLLLPSDLLLITADHGNDPTFPGSDHTREYVPLIAYQPGTQGRNLGIVKGFYSVGQSIAIFFETPPLSRGRNLRD